MGCIMYCYLDVFVNVISVCCDVVQVVVVGCSIFKIYVIEEEQFVEKLNLCVGCKFLFNLSCVDVVWYQMDENLLVIVVINGVVVMWNLGWLFCNKQDQLFIEYKCMVNKVCFYFIEVYVLFSGFQDGFMKCFDFCRKDFVSIFLGQFESVWDVQFSVWDYFIFVFIFENGNVQFWDIWCFDWCERMFIVYNGFVFCCDWYFEDRGWLVIGGCDKMVKVWDMIIYCVKEMYCVQIIVLVVCVKWWFECCYYLVMCFMMVDYNIYVWDVCWFFVLVVMFEEY